MTQPAHPARPAPDRFADRRADARVLAEMAATYAKMELANHAETQAIALASIALTLAYGSEARP